MAEMETSLLSPELTFVGLEASDRWDFFTKLGEKLNAAGKIKPTWFDAIVEREKNYPTGILFEGGAVAIPHTEPENLEEPYIAIVKPAHPIVFEHMAGMGPDVEAQLIVNLGIQHEGGQVAMLQALMGMFMDKAVIDELLAIDEPQALYEAFLKHLEAKAQDE
jgi:PTS system galactitol-specific IIA component